MWGGGLVGLNYIWLFPLWTCNTTMELNQLATLILLLCLDLYMFLLENQYNRDGLLY